MPFRGPYRGTDTAKTRRSAVGGAACRYARLFTNFPLEGLDFNDYYVEASQALLPRVLANFEQLSSWAVGPRDFAGGSMFNYGGFENEENRIGRCNIGVGNLC